MRQGDALHGSAVNSSDLYVSSGREARDIVELRFQLVCGAKQILLAPDYEDASGKNCQCYKDECP
jgi:hypothetical protein